MLHYTAARGLLTCVVDGCPTERTAPPRPTATVCSVHVMSLCHIADVAGAAGAWRDWLANHTAPVFKEVEPAPRAYTAPRRPAVTRHAAARSRSVDLPSK